MHSEDIIVERDALDARRHALLRTRVERMGGHYIGPSDGGNNDTEESQNATEDKSEDDAENEE